MIKFVFLILLCIFLVGCSKGVELNFEEVNYVSCPYKFPENEFEDRNLLRIDSLEAFEKRNCGILENKSINFSKYTLLSNPSAGSGCSTEFRKKVIRNDNEKIVYYLVKVKEIGNCEPLRSSQNIILVSKIPQDYEVKFERN